MIEKDINKIGEPELLSLKDNDYYKEGKKIEYKQSLPTNSKDDKIKFLAGISAFANAGGGDFIIGIIAEKGIAKKIEGVEIDDPDREKLRLEQIIRDGISPRIPSIIIRDIKLTNKKTVFIIRVYQSWISPHRVIFCGHDKFYSRDSAGKHPLDVNELRIAFNLTESLNNKIKNFRIDRISKIISGEIPIAFSDYPKIVLHFIPLSSLATFKNYELNKYFSRNKDGFIAYHLFNEKMSDIYIQIYRNGIIEYIEGWTLMLYEGNKLIYSKSFIDEIVTSSKRYLEVQKSINVDLPIILFMTLIGVKDYSLKDTERIFPTSHEKPKIDRNELFFPDILIEDYDIDIKMVLKPWFDLLWNACGYERCFDYNKD